MNSKTIKEKQKSLPKKENIEDAEKEKKKKNEATIPKSPKTIQKSKFSIRPFKHNNMGQA